MLPGRPATVGNQSGGLPQCRREESIVGRWYRIEAVSVLRGLQRRHLAGRQGRGANWCYRTTGRNALPLVAGLRQKPDDP